LPLKYAFRPLAELANKLVKVQTAKIACAVARWIWSGWASWHKTR